MSNIVIHKSILPCDKLTPLQKIILGYILTELEVDPFISLSAKCTASDLGISTETLNLHLELLGDAQLIKSKFSNGSYQIRVDRNKISDFVSTFEEEPESENHV